MPTPAEGADPSLRTYPYAYNQLIARLREDIRDRRNKALPPLPKVQTICIFEPSTDRSMLTMEGTVWLEQRESQSRIPAGQDDGDILATAKIELQHFGGQNQSGVTRIIHGAEELASIEWGYRNNDLREEFGEECVRTYPTYISSRLLFGSLAGRRKVRELFSRQTRAGRATYDVLFFPKDDIPRDGEAKRVFWAWVPNGENRLLLYSGSCTERLQKVELEVQKIDEVSEKGENAYTVEGLDEFREITPASVQGRDDDSRKWLAIVLLFPTLFWSRNKYIYW